MASLRRVSSLNSGLLTKPRLVVSNPVRGARPSRTVFNSQFKNGDRKKEDNEFKNEKSNTAIYDETVKCKESQEASELEKSRPATLDGTSYIVKKTDSAESSSAPLNVSKRVGKSLPWHSLLTFLKPKLNIQPLRYKSNSACVADDCDKTDNCKLDAKADDCKPRITTIDLPLTCVKTTKPVPPCKIPEQKKWTCCDKSMCLPCCCPIERPLKCKIFDTRLNTCPRKTYRIAAYSECNKRYGRKQYKKECCYAKRICYARDMADREIKPLIHIKDRQALALGFSIKALCDPPCQ